MTTAGENSFFHQNYDLLKVLVIVPHEDDEINAAGSLLYSLSQAGAQISLVYTTNGDWKYPAETRLQEAVNSAKVLGIPKGNIYFLGYGDAINNENKDHLFYHENTVVKSTSGHTETYGTDKYIDFAYVNENCHHAYTGNNYLSDLINIIRIIHADLIVCTDFDEHPDHRMLSVFFDKAIGIIKKEDPTYRPEIWKKFAYSLSYTALPDYTVINNPETKRPVVGITGKYEWDMIDTFIYQWKSRIRVPVHQDARSCILNNILAKALEQHKSQYIITKADGIINSDEVFWGRRTDSISYSAKVTVSSGKQQYLTDFMIYNVNDIDKLVPEFEDYFWRPDDKDIDKTVLFSWEQPMTIEKIVLYGAVSENGKIDELLISLSDGYQIIVANLPQNGEPMEVLLGRHENIETCEIRILTASGRRYGLSECEFYSTAEHISRIHPFCKMLIDDNFVYEYIVDEKTKVIPLGCYCYGDTGNIEIRVEKGKSFFDSGKLLIDKEDNEIILKAQNAKGDVWDQIVIKRLSKDKLDELHNIDLYDKKYLMQKKREKKFHNMLYILRHKGLCAVIKRTFKNIIRPVFIKWCFKKE